MKNSRGSFRLVAVLALAAGVTAGLLVLLSQLGGGARDVQNDEEMQALLANIPQNGTTLGQEDAPVGIRLYEDLQCPACAQFSRETFPDLVTRYVEPGEVKVVSETLAFLGPDSLPAAKAVLAAGEQDRYWQYATLFFLNQGEENSGYVTDEFLAGIAKKTRGLDVERWNEARNSGALDSELEEVRSRAQADGVQGTPTLLISGPGGERKLVGAVPVEDVAAAIDAVKER